MRTNYYRDRRPMAFKFDPRGDPRAAAAAPGVRDLGVRPAGRGRAPARRPIARGGLRWSDRREDFRTEVLGLMKAQMVKNAVIVPTGAKGGFVVKRPPTDPERPAGRGRRAATGRSSAACSTSPTTSSVR